MKRLQTIAYSSGTAVLLISGGGALNLIAFDVPGPDNSAHTWQLLSAVVPTLIAGIVTGIFGIFLFKRNRKRAVFTTITVCLSLIVTIYSAEFLARCFVPAWPVIGLHGVPPDIGYTAWAYAERESTNAHGRVNTWGQRDRDRTIKRHSDSLRIAFVGDSFLEESSTIPVSLAVEQKMSHRKIEILNLGISASGPDEYYYRVRNIAVPLQIDHCVVFVFAGNDFSTPARTLDSYSGVVAVYPRDSLFSTIRLYALNHLLTNRKRPVLRAWFTAGSLHERESLLGSTLAQSNDQQLRDFLYSLEYNNLSPQQRRNLAARLNSPGMVAFFDVLRHPDKERFRSYYLSSALWSASVGDGQWPTLSEDTSLYWVKKTRDLCHTRRIAFSLVVIPEAFQVDSRMCEQWKPLTNMRQLTAPSRTAASRLVTQARLAGIRTVDLHDVMTGVPGTYLNLDGHWSDKGVQIVSDVLSQELSKALAPITKTIPAVLSDAEPKIVGQSVQAVSHVDLSASDCAVKEIAVNTHRQTCGESNEE